MHKSHTYQFLLALTLIATFTLGPNLLPVSGARQEARTPVSNTIKKAPRSSAPSQLPNQPALQELSGVIAEAQNLTNQNDAFRVLSKSANILWLSSPAKSRIMFQELWQLAEAGGDRDELRTDILRYLAPRNAKLAATWLDQASSASADPRDVPYKQQLKGTDATSQRLNNLASKLIQQEDGTQAAKVLERTLAVAVTPGTLSTLSRLRQTNPALADSVVSRSLESLSARPTVVSLPSLYLLVDYVFPASNVDADAAMVNAPSRSLQTKYFSTAYNVVQKSLKESEEVLVKDNGYTKPDLRFRSMFQGQLAGVLVTLAPRFDRVLPSEFTVLASQSYAMVAPNAATMARFTRMRLSGSEESAGDKLSDIALALAKGDINRAQRLLADIEDEKVRKAVGQTIVKTAFNVYLAKSELQEALNEARKFEDTTVQAIAFAQLARAARVKGDTDFSKLIVANALSLFTGNKPSGLQARALLMLAPEAVGSSVPDALDLLSRAVAVINALPEVTQDNGEYNLDDPLSLRDAPEFQRAFSTIAFSDYEGTLSVARQVQPTLIGLLARLAVVETELKKPAPKTRRSATTLNHAVKSLALTAAFLENAKRLPSGSSTIDSSKQPGDCSCGPCMSPSSLTAATAAVPGPWWDCTSQCMRDAGVSPISVTLCGAACATGNVPICAICFALHLTAFNFCALFCAAYATPTYGTCLGWTDFITYPSSGCITGLFYQGPCTRSAAFRSKCEDYEEELCSCTGGFMSPIVIDVDKSGFSMTDAAGGVVFDMLKDGVPLGLSWTTPGSTNSLLVLDRNANGTIDNGEELFGDITPQPASSSPNGFLALAEYDKPANGGNGNRKLDSHDAVFSQLKLWRDSNHNGISEASELLPLSGLISAIDLDFKESRRTDQHGNQFRYRAKVYDVAGEHAGRWAWDVFLLIQ